MTFDFDQELVGSIPDLARFARRLTRNASEAEDLVQDCVERALRHRDKFEPGTNLPAWLTTILKNLHFTRHKRERRIERTELTDDTTTTEPVQESHVMLREVGEAMEHLSPVHRRLIEVVAIEGRSYQDAADTLDVSIGTIRSRLFRARTQLRTIRRRRRPAGPAARRPTEPAATGTAMPAADPREAGQPAARHAQPRLRSVVARRRIGHLLGCTALQRPDAPHPGSHRQAVHHAAFRLPIGLPATATPGHAAGSPVTEPETIQASCLCSKRSASPPLRPYTSSSGGCAGSTPYRAAAGSPSPGASPRATSSSMSFPSLPNTAAPWRKRIWAARCRTDWSIWSP